jgi:RNA polymerase sigma-70 factor (ECF subfamily)
MLEPDSELIRSAAAGDEQAFAELYDRHQARVYRFALLLSGNSAVAEEVTQEVFLALIREAFKYDPNAAPCRHICAAWRAIWCGAAWHATASRCRLKTKNQWASGTDVAGDLAEQERAESLRKRCLALPLRYREVVTLCHIEDPELSARPRKFWSVRRGPFCSRLSRARALLLQKMTSEI